MGIQSPAVRRNPTTPRHSRHCARSSATAPTTAGRTWSSACSRRPVVSGTAAAHEGAPLAVRSTGDGGNEGNGQRRAQHGQARSRHPPPHRRQLMSERNRSAAKIRSPETALRSLRQEAAKLAPLSACLPRVVQSREVTKNNRYIRRLRSCERNLRYWCQRRRPCRGASDRLSERPLEGVLTGAFSVMDMRGLTGSDGTLERSGECFFQFQPLVILIAVEQRLLARMGVT